MSWGKKAAALVVSGVAVLGLASCAQEPPFGSVEEMRSAAIEAGASGCGAEEAETLNTADSVGFRCADGLGMRLLADKSEQEIWERSQEGSRKALERLGITADNAADYPEKIAVLIAPGFAAEYKEEDQMHLVREIAAAKDLKIKMIGAEDIWSDQSWDSIE